MSTHTLHSITQARPVRARCSPVISAALLATACVAAAQTSQTQPPPAKQEPSTNVVSRTTLAEELRWLKAEKITISLASRHAEDPFGVAAAVAVISGEEIRRSGVRTIPEALRLAPGMQVAHVNHPQWAVSARGFNDLFSDKLLIMVDGRTIYSPIFNGVFWGAQELLMADVDRIEIVRGPGGTLWGANAVNGVINIVTKDARDTQGVFVETAGGTEERFSSAVRYGLALRDDVFVRGYVRFRDNMPHPGGHDGSDMTQGGVRMDWHGTGAKLTLSGDYFVNYSDDRIVIPNLIGPNFLPQFDQTSRFFGGNVLLKFERTFSDESDLRLQAYYDSFQQRDTVAGTFNGQEIVDVDFQHRFPLPGGQSVIYGFGYRYNPTTLRDSALFDFSVNRRQLQVGSAFIQDEIKFLDERLKVIIGTKVEHNDHTGWEVQPSGRIAWLPSDRHTLWGAVSRATQIPGRSYRDIASTQLALPPGPPAFPGAGPTVLLGVSNPNLQSQELWSYELGYRVRPRERLTLDFTAYLNRYDQLIGTASPPGFTPGLAPTPSFVSFTAANNQQAEIAGLEATFLWHASDTWRLQGSYSVLRERRRPDATDENRDATHMASIRSSWDLTPDLELDVLGRFVDSLTLGELNGSQVYISGYLDVDVRLAWRPHKNFELSVIGQNLAESRRIEFNRNRVGGSEVTPVPRGVLAMLTWSF